MSVWDRYEKAQAGALTPAEQAQLARDVVEGLRGMPADKRPGLARILGLPENAREKLGDASAAVVLGFFVEDEAARESLGVKTIGVWLRLNRSACLTKALAHAAAWSPHALWSLVDSGMDPSEVFDVLAPLYRENGNARRLFTLTPTRVRGVAYADELGRETFVAHAHARTVLADARFVDLALETVTNDPVATCCLLGVHGSARAVDELGNLLEETASFDGAVPVVAGLELALAERDLVDTLAAFLVARGTSFLEGAPQVPHPFALLLAQLSSALSQNASIAAQPALRDAILAFVPPMPVG